MLSLVACGQSGNSLTGVSGTKTAAEDFSDSIAVPGDDGEAGFYFYDPGMMEDGAFLYYYDDATGEAIKLCGKATCKHNDASCNAYFGEYICPYTIQYYDDRIYLWAEQRNESGQFADV